MVWVNKNCTSVGDFTMYSEKLMAMYPWSFWREGREHLYQICSDLRSDFRTCKKRAITSAKVKDYETLVQSWLIILVHSTSRNPLQRVNIQKLWLGSTPHTQDTSHHEDYYIFSRASFTFHSYWVGGRSKLWQTLRSQLNSQTGWQHEVFGSFTSRGLIWYTPWN